MSDVDLLVGSPVAEAIGWAVIHSVWEGALVSGALGATLLIARSSRVRYLAAAAALLSLFCAFCLTFFLCLPPNPLNSASSLPLILPVWKSLSDAPARQGWSLSLTSLAPWLAPFWLVGVFFFVFRNLTGWISVQRLRRRGACGVAERWRATLVRLRDRLGVLRSVELLESCLADTPMVVGHLRPVILMPVGLLTGMPVAQIEAILLHELSHVRRSDYLSNVVQRSIETLLFYHPAVWWISRTIRTEREHCCDDAVVALNGDVHCYASALAALEEHRWTEREPAIAATGGNLVNRIRRLMSSNRTSGPMLPVLPFLAGCVLIATAALATAAWKPLPPRHNAAAVQQQAPQTESSYDKWLDEDVVYIITDAERAAFERLSTDEERDKFIEQFWSRRNPSPGNPVNAFEQEHYRRLAYANAHFQTASGEPGWKTDRGHMYIVYGPPDEIDAHPNGGQKMKLGYQDWGYRHLEGVGDNLSFTFVDDTGHGDYRLTPNAGH